MAKGERKGQSGDECMHVNWIKEQEKEEKTKQAAEVMIFDSKKDFDQMQTHTIAPMSNNTILLAALKPILCNGSLFY